MGIDHLDYMNGDCEFDASLDKKRRRCRVYKRPKEYLYLIYNDYFKIVKGGVTTADEFNLILRYENAIGQVDKVVMYEIVNGE